MKDFKKFMLSSVLFMIIFLIVDHLAALMIEHGLKKYYGIDTNAEILINGSSQIMLGFDKQKIQDKTGLRVAKYTREGVNISDRYIMINHFLRNKPDSLKVVVYSTDQFLFTGEDLSVNSYTLFYPFMDDPKISEYIKQNSRNWYEYYIRKYIKCTRFDLLLINSSIRGYRGDWSNKKSGTVNLEELINNIKTGKVRKINSAPANVEVFNKTMQLLLERRVKVILLYIPYVDKLEYNDLKRAEVIALFRKFADSNQNVCFVDLTSELASHHQWYFDPNHLNPEGQKVATEKLIDSIKLISTTKMAP